MDADGRPGHPLVSGPPDPFEAAPPPAPDAAEGEGLAVDVTGYEGPLDLLLSLARSRKIDLVEVRIAELAEAYLGWLAEARRRRLDVAADYLVMAAWLAYLKSRLLLPEPEPEEVPAEELSRALAFRLKRLEAMREAADALFARPMVGRDTFVRGAPEATVVDREIVWRASLSDLLSAYTGRRQRQMVTTLTVGMRKVWSLVDARARLERLVGAAAAGGVRLDAVWRMLPADGTDPRSVVASSFGAGLELAREGRVVLTQAEPFGPIWLEAREREDGAP